MDFQQKPQNRHFWPSPFLTVSSPALLSCASKNFVAAQFPGGVRSLAGKKRTFIFPWKQTSQNGLLCKSPKLSRRRLFCQIFRNVSPEKAAHFFIQYLPFPPELFLSAGPFTAQWTIWNNTGEPGPLKAAPGPEPQTAENGSFFGCSQEISNLIQKRPKTQVFEDFFLGCFFIKSAMNVSCFLPPPMGIARGGMAFRFKCHLQPAPAPNNCAGTQSVDQRHRQWRCTDLAQIFTIQNSSNYQEPAFLQVFPACCGP